MATIAQFPDETNGGPMIARLIPLPVDYKVDVYRNEDGSAYVNVQPCGLRAYQIEYEGISAAELATLRAHRNLAKGKVNDFSFYNRQTEETLAGFKYESWRVGRHVKTWSRIVSVVLVRFE